MKHKFQLERQSKWPIWAWHDIGGRKSIEVVCGKAYWLTKRMNDSIEKITFDIITTRRTTIYIPMETFSQFKINIIFYIRDKFLLFYPI